jgi:hypothetical protein
MAARSTSDALVVLGGSELTAGSVDEEAEEAAGWWAMGWGF